jgi:hypothetical protein
MPRISKEKINNLSLEHQEKKNVYTKLTLYISTEQVGAQAYCRPTNLETLVDTSNPID